MLLSTVYVGLCNFFIYFIRVLFDLLKSTPQITVRLQEKLGVEFKNNDNTIYIYILIYVCEGDDLQTTRYINISCSPSSLSGMFEMSLPDPHHS